ncbi:MAG: nucleoside 2-deoxyribosyltransferase [Promethearchaeota archaeon]
MTKKICFLICPIGKEGSPERKRADQLYNHIVIEILKEYDFEVIRADKIGKPGIITLQIIEQLNSADLVIADLKGHNPNVFYELGIRHVIGKPIIQIYHPDERIPFDVSGLRSITLDIQDLDSVKNCITELKEQVESILENPEELTSPYTTAIDYQTLRSSENPIGTALADIKESIESLRTQIEELEHSTRFVPITRTRFDLSKYFTDDKERKAYKTLQEAFDAQPTNQNNNDEI